MFIPELLNQPETFSLDPQRLWEIVQYISEGVPRPQNGRVNIAFLPDDEIHSLNAQYRQKDSSTDVLSFHYFDDFSSASARDIVWEIVLSESYITRQATEHGHTAERESLILILHGFLHLLGYDHETDEEYEEMWKYEGELRRVIWGLA